ncbi:MAG: hypothetical protein PHQ83_01845 [Eubacteriales bacterium]|nr:hypothetical protein [Eubacteriales bacterium]
MARRLSPDSIDPFILAYAARLWTMSGLVLAVAGLAAVFSTAFIASWRVALLPLIIFLPAVAAAFWQRSRILSGRAVPESIATRYHRTVPCELVRLLLWLSAILIFLLWGLAGGWSLAWLVLVAAGLVEWLLDRIFKGRGCP